MELPESGFLRLRDVLRIIPVSRSTWYTGISEGRFPAPVKLAARCSAWRVQDIRDLVDRLSNEKSA